MRLCTLVCTLILSTVAFSPALGAGPHPGGSVRIGGFGVRWGSPGGVHIGIGHHGYGHHGHGHSVLGWGGYGYPWYGSYSGYSVPAQPYYVARPVVENPLPAPSFANGAIKITNPVQNGVTLSFSLNGAPSVLSAGAVQELPADRNWVVEFSRGASFGLARYALAPGSYTFTPTGNGWELYRSP